MLLDVKKIINAPGEKIDFQFDMDLSDVDFGGVCPAVAPVLVVGEVCNIAGMLQLRMKLDTMLRAVCDRCAWLDGQPCRFPDRMHPCVESHGINILPLIEELGLCFQYGENVVTWFSLLLY